MWIPREIESAWDSPGLLEARILIGSRQCGKSALLDRLGPATWRRITLDDLQQRELASRDPALFFEQVGLPAVIDEMQYAPALFPEIKRRIDEVRRRRRSDESARRDVIWATGSNQVFFDRHVKESLAGRASYLPLHSLSIAEIRGAFPDASIGEWLIRGGWPELWSPSPPDPVRYLNDYVRTYVEKDVVLASGIQKSAVFLTALGLIAARTGSLLNMNEIASAAGVQSTTIGDWVAILERSGILLRLPPYHSNLNKRLVKTPKIHVLDVGLAARLQGWREPGPAMLSPQIGGLFESLVVGEVVRTRDNRLRDWQLFLWRSRDGEEIDVVVRNAVHRHVAIEAKFAHQHVPDVPITSGLRKAFPDLKEILVVTCGGEMRRISRSCRQVPIASLRDVLLDELT